MQRGTLINTGLQPGGDAVERDGNRFQRFPPCPSTQASGAILLYSTGAIHGFNNLAQADAKALAVVTPALLGPDFIKEAAAIVNAGGPPDVSKLSAVMSKHGLVAVMPGTS